MLLVVLLVEVEGELIVIVSLRIIYSALSMGGFVGVVFLFALVSGLSLGWFVVIWVCLCGNCGCFIR